MAFASIAPCKCGVAMQEEPNVRASWAMHRGSHAMRFKAQASDSEVDMYDQLSCLLGVCVNQALRLRLSKSKPLPSSNAGPGWPQRKHDGAQWTFAAGMHPAIHAGGWFTLNFGVVSYFCVGGRGRQFSQRYQLGRVPRYRRLGIAKPPVRNALSCTGRRHSSG